MSQPAEDVAAASAAYLFNMLPALMSLDDRERYRRLQCHVLAALAAYRDCTVRLAVPEPSDN